jgi:molybdopterin-guanine dinucleotide biosynthesis protein
MPARDNPFRSERIGALAFRYPPGCDQHSLLGRLAAFGHRAAIVGPAGSGKTTLSRDLERALGRDYRIWRVTQRHGDRRLTRHLPQLDVEDYVVLDGAEQLAWVEVQTLRWQARGAGGLLMLSHRPVGLPTLLATATSQALLDDLIAELVPGRRDIAAALAHHGGNVRAALRALYDECAAA